MAEYKPSKFQRQQASSLSELMPLFIMENGLWDGLYRQAVFDAWDKVSGLGRFTVNRFLKDGVLHITLTSSVVRSRAEYQKSFYLAEINTAVKSDGILAGCGDVPGIKTIKFH